MENAKKLWTTIDCQKVTIAELRAEIEQNKLDMAKYLNQAIDMQAEIERMKEKPICYWKEDKTDEGVWDTSCGERFVIFDGTPNENKMAYCPYCGCVLEEKEVAAEIETLQEVNITLMNACEKYQGEIERMKRIIAEVPSMAARIEKEG